jgi:tRNA threonylcarbamoyladenosine biosynthesis protein TsaB
MRILAVDTSSERGSICVTDGGEVLGEVRLASSIQHVERLFRSLEFLLEYLPFSLADVDMFVAARGPGSFTGLRVGLAAMEGFAAAHGKRGGGVSTLQSLAWKTGVKDVLIAPTIDARRGEVYGALYRRTQEELIEERAPVVLKPAEWLSSLPDRDLVFCGDGAIRYRSMIEEMLEEMPGEKRNWRVHSMDLYLAAAIAELALTPACGPLEPLYVRKTDAEIAREGVRSPNS